MLLRPHLFVQLLKRHYAQRGGQSSDKIRQQFIDYFVNGNGHTFVRSSPVVPFCDPTVAFVNAGMNQFKNVFLGAASPPAKRVANSQKCIRVGGKHNDLSVVGTDGYHHTFFEMLGNWSFGDYFKADACRMAWELVTGPLQIDPRRLYVTYFGGDETLNLQPDLECRNIWLSLGVPKERIIPFGCRDNFWEMGSTGPCGPCTEIHIDHVAASDERRQFVNAGRADLTELWNIVFIEYNRHENGVISQLPQKHIDTGMGFERLVAVMQGKSNNYDTDLFTPLFDIIQKTAKCPEYQSSFSLDDKSYDIDTGYRILTDHSRMVTACLADGMFPDQNHKLRRILRKILLLSETMFNNKQLVYEVIPKVAETLGQTYGEMQTKLADVIEIVKHEQELFESLRCSMSDEFKKLIVEQPKLGELSIADFSPGFVDAYKEVHHFATSTAQRDNVLPGKLVYKLYDTYGLGQDTIEKIAELFNLQLDAAGFKGCLVEARKRTAASNSHNVNGKDFHPNATIISHLLETAGVSRTRNEAKYEYDFDPESSVYRMRPIEARIVAIVCQDTLHETISGVDSTPVHIVCDMSNFYFESGGQECDMGVIRTRRSDKAGGDIIFDVRKTSSMSNYVLHSGTLQDAKGVRLSVGDTVELCVDEKRRTGNTRNHTVIHLLNACVRSVVEKAVVYQKSSVVTNGMFKLDLGVLGVKLDDVQIKQIENRVRSAIAENIEVSVEHVNATDVLAMNNSVTLVPGETYPDRGLRLVRVENSRSGFKSAELCCGTHAGQSGELLDFCLTSVKLIGRGSYSFSGVTGEQAKRAQLIGHQLADEMKKLKHDLESDKQNLENLDARVNRFKKELVHGNESEWTIPYTVRLECTEMLNSISKQIKDSNRDSLREFVEIEMTSVLETYPPANYPFIVYFLKSSSLMEDVPLQKATKCCPERPIIVLSLTNGMVKARCCVPKMFVSSGFTAEKWLGVVGAIFKAKIGPPKGQSADEICNMKAKKIMQSTFDENLDNAIRSATEYADQYWKPQFKDADRRKN